MRVISCPYDQALGLGAVAFITSLQGRKTSVHHLQGRKKTRQKKCFCRVGVQGRANVAPS